MEKCYANNQESLFRKYAKLTTWLANTSIGRSYLGVPKDIGLMLPNGFIQGDKSGAKATFYTRPVFAPKLYPALARVDAVYEYIKYFKDLNKWYASFKEFQKLLVWNLNFRTKYVPALAGAMFTTTTFYPNANPETTSVDGDVSYLAGSGAAWATIHDATEGTGVDDFDATANVQISADDVNANTYDSLRRGFALFDTSSLGAGATIGVGSNVASFHGNSYNSNEFGGGGGVALVSSNPAVNTTLQIEDYDTLGTTKFATNIAIGSWTTSDYNDFTLNTDGDAAISKTGITKFGLRIENDRANTAPTWGGANDYYVDFITAEAASTTSDPKLVIIYTPAPSSGFFNFL